MDSSKLVIESIIIGGKPGTPFYEAYIIETRMLIKIVSAV